MLPFHKRSRVNSSNSIEIGTDELEAIELPHVRPPSVRPSAFLAAPVMSPRPSYRFNDDDEMTVIRPDKRLSSRPPPPSPPPKYATRMPVIPRAAPPPRARAFAQAALEDIFEESVDDEPTTMLHPGSRPLLSMSSRNISTIPPAPPSSRARMDDAPVSAVAVDASASGAVRDLSMTSSLSGATDIRRMRGHGAAWGAALVAVGVLAGLVVAFVARGEGIAAAAALVDPSGATADIKAVASQAPVTQQGAVTQPQALKPAAPSCIADVAPVAKIIEPKVEAKVEAPKLEAKAEPKPVAVSTYVAPVAPRAVVHHTEPVQVAAVASPTPPPVAKPAKATRRSASDDMESASAADALAKAQLEAALSR